MPLYHAELGFPRNMREPRHYTNLRYSAHARQAAQTDRYGHVSLPRSLDFQACQLVEAEVECDGTVSKAVVRQRYDDRFDLVLVVHPSDGFVRTVWLNDRRDLHKTLKYGRYAKP